MEPANSTVRVHRAHAKPELTARQILDGQVTEKAYMQQIIDLARKCGYYCYHCHDSRRSMPGFPDLMIIADRIIFLEVKTETGKLSPEQRAVIHRLRSAGCLAMVVRPSNWSDVEHMLLSGRWQEAG